MKALVFTDIREMTYRDVPDPQLESDEILIRVRAAGFCGSELESFVGKSRRRKPPLIMGHEFSGEIAAAGDDVTDVSIGQRAAVNPLIPCGNCHYCGRGLTNACPNRLLHSLHLPGAFAEYIAVKRSSVFPVAESLPYQHAAMAEPLANGLHVNSLISDCSPKDVVVFGAGVIGLMCLQAAMLAGATRTTVVDRWPGRLEIARRIGADETIDAGEKDAVARVRELGGSDLAIDAVGAAVTRQQALEIANPGSAVVYIGTADTFGEINGHEIVMKELKVFGSYGYTDDDFRKALNCIEAGEIHINEWIDLFPLADGHAAINRLIDEPDRLLKVILQP